ncbi:hypothetical protein P4S96_02855 [Aneurinibacillus thermoaerophilus]|uniref:hypothetical protein n=1 Tax=Aneurinibacillus thermoaerophilus TaxID=143495 RepID=UPI002E1C44AA|nr:hypothetical protein [Aneurinibacillus thermoaerophilus]MED0756139.1 hypothetical protein [Aneurinibacillus thermoaerophilus]MED0766322.1 hypothetical protein [Aneurinibacillus thermoaerophilus]
MSNIKLSIDRIVIEYRDVYWTFFNPFKQSICDYYGIKERINPHYLDTNNLIHPFS